MRYCMNENFKLTTYLELKKYLFTCKTLEFFSFLYISCFAFTLHAPASICPPIISKGIRQHYLWLVGFEMPTNQRSRPLGGRPRAMQSGRDLSGRWLKNINKRAKIKENSFLKISVKLKLPCVNDTPKIHLRSLGSVNFIDDWLVHEIFVKLSL